VPHIPAAEAEGFPAGFDNIYPDSDAAIFRAALSKYTGLDGSHIILSHGSNELINLLWHIYLSVGDSILCCPPTFSLYSIQNL
jgi:histidinol-phosphate aminotransferase